jgi:signal transduction histidine kinase/CheY-like chemotaxis protein
MKPSSFIYFEKRQYANWVSSQTLEDYALRFTATKARRWSARQVANTAVGACAFLACEALGAAITLSFGFSNALAATAAAVIVMFIIGLPIAYHAAKAGVDIDLLSRSAGFGYLGSTITSLIYATFTFLLFALEASIMAIALEAVFGLPLSAGYLISSLVVIPIVIYGMRAITLFQALTQPIWVILQLLPIIYLAVYGSDTLANWGAFVGLGQNTDPSLIAFGLAFSTLLSLLPQIGEQADYLRFLPPQKDIGKGRWWAALIIGGPGWTLIAGLKIVLGSVLAVHVLGAGGAPQSASDPTAMFQTIFKDIAGDGKTALIFTGLFVITCQLKINVTNAYAGSIAWSNVFARLTYAHPGRVVWIVLNVSLALMLMLLGVLEIVSSILVFYALVAAGWIGALSGDLLICKPLGLSPAHVEFKRAHLFDINPVGCGSMAIGILLALACYFGFLGSIFQAFSPAIALVTSFAAAPLIAVFTQGRYYIARDQSLPSEQNEYECVICENTFEHPDMAHCPHYAGPICSLCCTLEMRCKDACKDASSAREQADSWIGRMLPDRYFAMMKSEGGKVFGLMAGIAMINGAALWLIYLAYPALSAQMAADTKATISPLLWVVFGVFTALSSIAAIGLVLANRSRNSAEREAKYHVDTLIREIAAHDRTEQQLASAQAAAEAANEAKSQFLMSVSHEIRAPLNSIYGYAQLLQRNSAIDTAEAAKAIGRSSQHLSDLVDGLLDISSVENSVMRLNPTSIRFREFLSGIALMFQPEASAKGLDFIFDTPANLPDVVKTDAKRLRQILINLLSNAVKFTDSGTVTFKVRYQSQIVTFEVIDTGMGIAPENQSRVLEPFERGSLKSISSRQGVGLGLSIANTLVKIMGGDLQVSSALGEGTCFRVRLMLSQPREPKLSDSSPRLVTGYKGPRRSILIIDDDPVQCSLVTALLQPLGFDIKTAGTGTQGVNEAEIGDFDACLLDLTLPDMTGWDVAKTLRTTLGKTMPIIIVSADAHQHKQGGDGHADHDHFLIKPLDMDMLIDTLGALLGLKWVSRSDSALVADTPQSTDPISAAQVELLKQMRAQAEIGQAKAVQSALTQLRGSGGAGPMLADKLSKPLDYFDFVALIELIERVLDNPEDLAHGR